MTIPIKDLRYDALEQLLQHPDISQNELNLLLHTIAFIQAGCTTSGEISEAFRYHPMREVIMDLMTRDPK